MKLSSFMQYVTNVVKNSKARVALGFNRILALGRILLSSSSSSSLNHRGYGDPIKVGEALRALADVSQPPRTCRSEWPVFLLSLFRPSLLFAGYGTVRYGGSPIYPEGRRVAPNSGHWGVKRGHKLHTPGPDAPGYVAIQYLQGAKITWSVTEDGFRLWEPLSIVKN